jgi:4'-phosphopantetheinyl transferase EntD
MGFAEFAIGPAGGRTLNRSRAGDADTDTDLAAALVRLVSAGVLIGHRRIAMGDEHALLQAEAMSFARCAPKVRRRSGGARIVARELLRALGEPSAALPRSASGPPVWPSGIVGSMAHDDEVAVAAVARSGRIRSLGVDIEPADALPRELVAIVATATERARYSAAVLESRILFCVKEAVFKALYPLCGLFLDFHDIEIEFDAGLARVRHGHSARIAFIEAPSVVALAVI